MTAAEWLAQVREALAEYSLIADDRRAFGIDNLDGWHEHPLGAPASHLPCDEPSPEAAVLRLKAASEQAKSLPEP